MRIASGVSREFVFLERGCSPFEQLALVCQAFI